MVEAIQALQPDLEQGAADLEAARNAVADAAIAGEDVEALRAEYQRLSEEYTNLLNQVVELEQSALPLVKETTDEIIRRYGAGESFDSLIRVFAQEAGEEAGAELLFHPDSENWANTFKDHVSALKEPGDITEPFVTDLGIHIVYYQADLPSGVHELTEEERTALESAALEAKQMEKLQTFLEEWRGHYQIETHPELLQ